jgi:hypothetical protein
MIRKLLVGRLTFTPDEDDDGRFYLYEGRADRLHPIRGTVRAARALVTPGGYSEGWNASLTFCIEGVALAA